MKNILIRAAEVKAATQAVPNALLALCNMILPMAVIENCNPIGTPIANKVRASPAWNLRSSEEVARKIGNFRSIYK